MKKYIVTVDEFLSPFEANYPIIEKKELITCKDCKYSVDEYDDGDCYCDYEKDLRYIKDWDHYCAWAERKEEQ